MKTQISSYLEYIGFDLNAKANLETLTKLHLLHTLRIPFENLNPYLDMPVSLEMTDLFKKMVDDKRGGYCFEHNTLFFTVLRELGFKVKGLGARVLWGQPEDIITRRSHMLLAIEIDNKTYLADVGFGGLTLTTPLIFEIGLEQPTTHEVFRIERLENDYKLQVKMKDSWRTLYRFDLQEQFAQDYDVVNYYLSTHRESPFKKDLIAAKPTKNGRLALKNNQFTLYNKDAEAKVTKFETENELKECLKDSFNIRVLDSWSLAKVFIKEN